MGCGMGGGWGRKGGWRRDDWGGGFVVGKRKGGGPWDGRGNVDDVDTRDAVTCLCCQVRELKLIGVLIS